MQATSPAEPLPARRTRSASSDNAAADRFSAWQKRTAAVRRAGTRMSAQVVNSGSRLLAFPIRAPRHHPNAQMFPPHARARSTVSASTNPRSVGDRHARRSLDDKSPARGPSEYDRRGLRVAYLALLGTGYDHAYDWITAIAHTSSCGKTQPYVKRFEVVLAVIAAAKPASCPNSRQIPPAGMGTPLTDCQTDALRAWLAEPMVSQMHVPEADDTAAQYPAGPYLMPPFN
jgi:hypothetical protein